VQIGHGADKRFLGLFMQVGDRDPGREQRVLRVICAQPGGDNPPFVAEAPSEQTGRQAARCTHGQVGRQAAGLDRQTDGRREAARGTHTPVDMYAAVSAAKSSSSTVVTSGYTPAHTWQQVRSFIRCTAPPYRHEGGCGHTFCATMIGWIFSDRP
jgi:hypothetical protein